MFRYAISFIPILFIIVFQHQTWAYNYTEKIQLTALDQGIKKISGISWNPNTKRFITIHSGQKYLAEYDKAFNFIRYIYNGSNGSKLEDIRYLGTNANGEDEYAIVIEQGLLFIGVLPQNSNGFKLNNWQKITFASWGSSYGAEGIAYNPHTETFYACKENLPRKIIQFQRPAGNVSVPAELGSFEPFDAETALTGIVGSMNSCRFNTVTQLIEILSKTDGKIIEVDLTGNVHKTIALSANIQYRGFDYNDDQELIVVSPSSHYQVFTESNNNDIDIIPPSTVEDLSARVNGQSVTLTWSASTDNIAMSHYILHRNGQVLSQIPHSDNQNIHNYQDDQVISEKEYSYQISAVDTSGNESIVSPVNGIKVLISGISDTEAPTPPTNLAAQYINKAITLSWDAAQDNIAVTHYQIYRDDQLLITLPFSQTANFVDEQVIGGQTYRYQISATDAAGNVSTIVPVIGLTISIPLPPIDIEPPTAPTQVTGVFNGQAVTINWIASTDNVAVTQYQILRDEQVIGSVSDTTFIDNSVITNQTYLYQIVAFDQQGNSQASALVEVLTTPTNNNNLGSPYSLNQYVKSGQVTSIHDTPVSNLSGITFNVDKQQYIALYNGSSTTNLFDANVNFIKSVSNGKNGNDHEDLMYLGVTSTGRHEYAVVDEYGRLHLGNIDANADFTYKNFQQIIYAPAASNAGGEGVAYNRNNDMFYVCIEGRNNSDPTKDIPMKILQFKRPSTTSNVSYLDGSLAVSELFNAEQKLNSVIRDISSCYFNNRDQHLLIMSEQSEKIIEVDLDGNILFELNIDETINDPRLPPHGSQFEGFTFNEDFTQLILVSEGHYYVTYQANPINDNTLVNVSVTEPASVSRNNAIATTGVPLPQGLVFETNELSLYSGEQKLPSQFKPLSHWSDGSIRWLLMDAKISLNANETKSLSLKSGASSPTSNAIEFTNSVDNLTVNTGPLVVEIPKNYGGIINKAWLNGTLLIDSPQQVSDRGAYIATNNSTYFSSLLSSNFIPNSQDNISDYLVNSASVDTQFPLNRNDPLNLSVTIEQQGELHSIVKVSGAHVNSAGDSFSSFIIRLHFYAGKSEVDVEHSLIYTGDDTQPISSYGLKIPFIGNSTVIDGETANTGELVQQSYRKFQLNNEEHIGQAQGYVSRTNANGSLSVVLRDMAERFPKALVATANEIDIQLYPSSVSPWQLTRYIPETAESEFSSFPLNQIATYQGETTGFTDHFYLRGAQGLSVTDNYQLSFSSTQPSNQALRDIAAAIDFGPLLMLADGQWYSDSLVMGVGKFSFNTDLSQSEGHYRINKFLQTTADFMRINQRKQFDWFGIENYGDIRGRFFGSKTELYWHTRGRYGWSGNSGEPSNQLWTQFLRQPSQQLFLDAEALARHTADQQMVHYADATQSDKSILDGRNLINSVGSLHRHGVQAWSGYANSADYSHIAGIETYYYLTGNQRAKDALYEAGLFILRQRSDKTSIKNGIDVLDRVAAVFADDAPLTTAIETKLLAYNNYLTKETNEWNTVEARLIDFNNNGLHDRDGDGKSNRQLFRTAFEFFIRAAPGMLYRYERTKDPVIGQLIMDAANILVAGDGDDWDLTIDGHAGSYFYHMNLLSFAAQYASELGYEPAPYYALAKRAIENNTHAGNDTNDTSPVSLASVQAVPSDWQNWQWLWQEEIDPLNPGILWLSRLLMYQNNTLQDYHSYRAFIHLATCAAAVPPNEMILR